MIFDRAPLLRFYPLQHSLAALRCVGLPASTQSRFGVLFGPPALLRAHGRNYALAVFRMTEAAAGMLA